MMGKFKLLKQPVAPVPPRKLAYIRKISDVQPIKSYTEKVVATVDGWSVAVDPGLFKKGDLALFIEIDAFLPAADKRFDPYGHLQEHNEKLGYRIQTRIYGKGKNKIVSQGCLFPLKDFPEVDTIVQELRDGLTWLDSKARVDELILIFYDGWDFAETLKITKWDEKKGPENSVILAAPHHLGNYPPLIRKSNHERVQKCPNLFTKAKYKRFVFQESVKMDGASMTVYFVKKKSAAAYKTLHPLPEEPTGAIGPNMVFKNGRFGVCSHKYDLNELGGSDYWAVARDLGLPAKLARLGRNVAILGELCGDTINQNRERLPPGVKEFFVFAMWDIDQQAWIDPKETERRAKELGLKHVPVLGYVKIRDIAKSHDELLLRAARQRGEGLVFKCLDDGRWFKVISNTYLLEHSL